MKLASIPTMTVTLNTAEAKFRFLQTCLKQIRDLEAAAAVLNWDQTTFMPPGGASARGRQIATLKQVAHEKLTDPVMGQLLEDLKSYERDLPYDSLEASEIRVGRRDYDRAARIPSEFMARLSQHQAASYEVWAKAKSANDFAAVQPYLEKMLDLSREMSSFFPHEHIADPLIDFYDSGMTVATLRPLFAELRGKLRPIVEAITSCPPIDDSFLHQDFPAEQQLEFTRTAIDRMGYDFQRGRQDESPHPFSTSFSIGDVRITTRIYENNCTEALFSSIHEAGHGMYEQGIAAELEGSVLANGTSSGLHESQSRLWENIVGRSRGFWECFYPQLQGIFLRQLGSVSIIDFYRAINKVAKSPIRTEADEVTYNLHVAIRFDLELAMLEGKLPVSELRDAWRDRYESDLGIIPPNDTKGVLQDVHWYCGTIGGMFQGYTLGNLMSAQLYESAVKINPEIPVAIERGNFSILHDWLIENIYQHGRKYTATEMMERITGKSLSIDHFINYIRDKYMRIYRIKL